MQYFLQNIKKSRSGIIFSSIILPLFTILVVLLFGSEGNGYMDFATLSVFQIFFMYIIPVVLSISLFSYVYKKSSADFIGSMPLSRKSIFVTNTIGGIVILAIIEVITMIVTFLASLLFGDLIVFGAMVWDVFIYFTVAYIFVFITCNLAMSFSGSALATIATTMVVLFFVPFLLFTARVTTSVNMINSNRDFNSETNELTVLEKFNFTAPSYIFDVIANDGVYEYNVPSMIKMLALSIAYFVIGLELFKRKKFEMAGESFENNVVHLVIKLLSLAPFFAIGVGVNLIEFPIAFIFFFAVVAVYYFLFDIITKKKINVGVSIATFIGSFAIMYVLFALIVPHLDELAKTRIKIDDIESIKIASLSSESDEGILTDLVVDDETLIYEMLSDFDNTYYYNDHYQNANIIIRTKNGKNVPMYIWNIPNMKKIIEKYGDRTFSINLDNSKIALSGATLSREDKKTLRECIIKDLDQITYKELYSILRGDMALYNLTSYEYVNHEMNMAYYNSSAMENTFKKVVKIMNSSAYKYVSELDFMNMSDMKDFEDYVLKMNPIEELKIDISKAIKLENGEAIPELADEEEFEYTYIVEPIMNGIRNIDKKTWREYLSEHKDDEFDIEKPYYTMWFVTSNHGFYSNDLEGLYKIFAKVFNEKVSDEYGYKLKEIE
jgi:ABC-type transport system involved in multi-copper enzyme maturation permease subunit